MKTSAKLLACTAALAALVLASCTVSADTSPRGKISGTVTYSNVAEESHGGIIVTLDRTDGLRTARVEGASQDRSAAETNRSVAAKTVTAADGTYRFERLEAGTYTVYASSSFSTEKAVCTNVVVRSAETTLAEALNLTATGSISGTVTVDGSDIENTGFLVFVAGTSYMAVTDAGGNYTISGVPAGSGYMVVAQRNGVIHSLCTDITVSAGETTQVAAADFTADELTAGLKGDAGADGKDGRDGLDGKDGVNGTNGKDGAGITWLGTFDSADEITSPAYLDAYFNNTDGCSYIYTKAGWVLLARAGANGAAGKDGRDGLDGKDGVNGTNGTNGKDGKDGANGADGVSIVWKGELAAAPAEPELNWAYYNTEAGCAYIWNGTKWDKLSERGATGETGAAGKDGKDGVNGTNGTNGKDGKDGANGADGVSIVWKGELAAAPAEPQLNWAYYNTEAGCAYIWNGTKWDLLAGTELKAFAVSTDITTETVEDSDLFVINVNVTKQNIKEIGYVYSVDRQDWLNAKAIVESSEFVSVEKNSEGKYRIIASVNGYYSIAVKDSDGFVVYTQERIVGKAKVQSITLNRYHLAYNDPDQTISVVANLRNKTYLDDETLIEFYTKDSGGNVTKTVATVDKTLGTATATINVPETSASDIGTTYTVLCKIGDEEPDTTQTVRFNVSAESKLTALSLSYNGAPYTEDKVQVSLAEVTEESTVTVRIQGYNLDLTRVKIYMYDSKGIKWHAWPVDESSVLWTAANGSNYQTIDKLFSVPDVDDCYTVKVLFGNTVQTNYTGNLQIYDEPKFKGFNIPLVSITKKNNVVIATIEGKNFDTPDVELSNFTATCDSNPDIVANTTFKKNTDNFLSASFTIPRTVGVYDIIVNYGSKSITGTLKVGDFSAYSVGDVLLESGSIIKPDLFFAMQNIYSKDVVGLLYFNEYDAPAGFLGLYNSVEDTNGGSYVWSASETTGYNIKVADIICIPSKTGSGAARTAKFTCDTDGSNNWNSIRSIDSYTNTSSKYPAFNYADNYGTTFHIINKYAHGWYIPSLPELCYIYKNLGKLNSMLGELKASRLSADYWSSSQNADFDNEAWVLDMSTGSIKNKSKGSKALVCCVRPFKNEKPLMGN